MSILDKLALLGIKFYQKYISPKKGYRCAYSVVYGGTGCSGAVKEIILENGLWTGYPMIQKRFASCKEANEERKKRNNRNIIPDLSDCIGDGCDTTHHSKNCDLPEMPDCDLPDCDVGGCDCSF
jgi:putative component of membrane protein insertase Oxa1/YidC/SpoIIIJ protein YidD